MVGLVVVVLATVVLVAAVISNNLNNCICDTGGRVYPDLYCHHSEGVFCENIKFVDNNKSAGLQYHCSNHTKCLPPKFSSNYFFSRPKITGF